MAYARRFFITILLLGLSTPAIAEEVFFDSDCLPCVVNFLKETRHSLRGEIFDINEPTIVDTLMDLHWRGKRVQILSDRRQAGGKYSRVVDLYLMGIDIRLNSKKNLQHNKFAVRDGNASIGGSFNWTRGAARRNSEDVTLMRGGWFRPSVNASLRDYLKKLDDDWGKNTQAKSDGYFDKIISKNRAEILERWKEWITTTLRYESPWSRKGNNKVRSALRMVEKLAYYPPQVVTALEAVAKGKFPVDARAAALRLLGKSKTKSYSAHATLAEVARFGRPSLREAAEHAMAELGKGLRLDPETYWKGVWGGLRVFRARCGQVFRFLRPW